MTQFDIPEKNPFVFSVTATKKSAAFDENCELKIRLAKTVIKGRTFFVWTEYGVAKASNAALAYAIALKPKGRYVKKNVAIRSASAIGWTVSEN